LGAVHREGARRPGKSESRKVPVPPSEMVDMRPDEVPLVEEDLGEMLLIEVNRLRE